MISRKELFEREDGFLFERCVAVDKATKETMKQLGLKMFKSSKDRTKDVEKAKELDLLLDQILTSNNVETKEEPVESIEENEIKEDVVADLSPSEKDAEIEISRTIDKSDESKELTLF